MLVDHNVEQVILEEENDTRRFYYLQEENDKLVEIAWSDQVLENVTAQTGVPVTELRADYLLLSHPGDGGWHLIAESNDPQQAEIIAAAWGQEFYAALAKGGPGVNPIMEFNLVQADYLEPERVVEMGVYLFFGSLAGSAVLAFVFLFFHRMDG